MTAENEMTVPEMTTLTADELNQADRKGLETSLYVIRGLGMDRDRYMTIAEFVGFIQQLFGSLRVYTAEGKKTVLIDNGSISSYNNIDRNSFSLSDSGLQIQGGFKLAMDDDKLEYLNGDFKLGVYPGYCELKTKKCKLYFDNTKAEFTSEYGNIRFKGDVLTLYNNVNVNKVEISDIGIAVYSDEKKLAEINGGTLRVNHAISDECSVKNLRVQGSVSGTLNMLEPPSMKGATVAIYNSPADYPNPEEGSIGVFRSDDSLNGLYLACYHMGATGSMVWTRL